MKTLVVMGILWKVLCRDRLGLGLYVFLPVAFLTMFGLAFGGIGAGNDIRIKIGVLDLDRSPQSRALIDAVRANSERMELESIDTSDPGAALLSVRDGTYPGTVLVPEGFGKSLLAPDGPKALELYYDTSNPIAPELAQGKLLEGAARGLAPALVVRRLDDLQKMAGPLTGRQDALRTMLTKASEQGSPLPEAGKTADPGVIPIEAVSSSRGRQDRSLVTYYTGAIGMMFLMFSATTICGSLLEERENGLTARLSALGIGPWQMILGRFLFAALIGIAQFMIMLVWAGTIFDVGFLEPVQLLQLALLVPLAAGAAAGLGLIVSVPCATRRQQATISTIIVLLLSALGGSMVPSFMLPEYMQFAGRFVFNWWAIDAFQQVLWYTAPDASFAAALGRIDVALGILLATAIAGLIFARAIFRWRA